MIDINIIQKVTHLMKNRKLDALLVAPSNDLDFLTGSSPWLCERFQGLIIKQDGSCFYIVNLLSGAEVRDMFGQEMKIYTWHDSEDFTDVVNEVLNQEGLCGKTIGTNMAVRASNILRIMERTPVKFRDAADILQEARIKKTSQELDKMRHAAYIADRALEAVWGEIRPGMSEAKIQEILYGHIAELGGADPYGIVSIGANASYPHYEVKGEGAILGDKDILLIDFECAYEGYWADMTRTVFIGEPTEEERKIYHTVLEANLAGEGTVREGVYIPDIDSAAREVIERAGYGEYFTTRLGHGIGRQPHEAPEIKKSNPRNLEKGMAFSIEPGIYIPGKIGVRIEDIVVVNENGEREILNKLSKELVII